MASGKKLKVLIVGSGGREHALVLASKRSPMLERLVCAPGNGGIERDCEVAPIPAEDVSAIAKFGGGKWVRFRNLRPGSPALAGAAATC